MKKIICAAAAFAMVAGVASVASAKGVTLGGDARARWIIKDNGSKESNEWNSRFRVKITGKTEGGAFAKARIRLADTSWDGTNLTRDKGEASNIYTDYAWIGIPVAKGLMIEGGLMTADFSPWFYWDGRKDRFKVTYKTGGFKIVGTFDKDVELTDNEADEKDDNDQNSLGVSVINKFGDALTAKARIVYVMDNRDYVEKGEAEVDTGAQDGDGNACVGTCTTLSDVQPWDDKSGMKGSVNVAAKFGGSNLIAEVSYKAAGVAGGGADDQVGAYAEWNAKMGAIIPTVRLGTTMDGFKADADWGWIMIGSGEPITMYDQVGQGGDTIFLGASSKFLASENLALQANFVYMDVDTDDMANPMELSGQVVWKVAKGAELSLKAGYLGQDSDQVDDGFGIYTRFRLKF
ncbi:MAG: hypothetical protein ABFS19_11635 [Thermodesulfobacteriota bacterium]